MDRPRYPSLFQVNTRAYLSQRACELGRPATLDDVPDEALDAWARAGFDLIWLLGVWQTGPAARRVSATKAEWLEEYRRALPDFAPEDVCGSCFAVQAYRVHEALGGDGSLARLRARLATRGLRLILDFVPNHTAPDHPWAGEHPESYVGGTEAQLAAQPQNYSRREGGRILAYGRDPYFDGWPDTLQLNYGNPDVQAAMRRELLKIGGQCDGVRCDMAMLVLPEVFERTWGIQAEPFWPRATQAVREAFPGFLFLAEAYWDLEWALQQQGFDYVYDKRLYDRLAAGQARPAREHLQADLAFQNRLARFLENHDEPRAAETFAPDVHRAAAVVTFLAPGLRFFHQGQLEGRKVKIPVHLRRGPAEPAEPAVRTFYDALLGCLRDPVFREGEWRLLACRAAWEGNWTWDCFMAFAWTGGAGEKRLVAVNYADHASQCYVAMPWPGLESRMWRLSDRLGRAVYVRNGSDLAYHGLYLDMPAWAYHVFQVEPVDGG